MKFELYILKELIPEFYMNGGKYLINNENLDLGIEIDGVRVDDVILPNWANVIIYYLINRVLMIL